MTDELKTKVIDKLFKWCDWKHQKLETDNKNTDMIFSESQ